MAGECHGVLLRGGGWWEGFKATLPFQLYFYTATKKVGMQGFVKSQCRAGLEMRIPSLKIDLSSRLDLVSGCLQLKPVNETA